MEPKKKPSARLRMPDFWILSAACLLLVLFALSELQNHLGDGKHYSTAVLRALLLSVICALFYCGARLHGARSQNRILLSRVMWLFFFLYLYLLLTFTLFDKSLGRGWSPDRVHRSEYIASFVNLRPFRSIYEVYIRGFQKGLISTGYLLLNLLGNLVAFMPLAFFLPRLFRPMRRWFLFLPTLLLSVASVELFQFALMVGSCDIDDLILNGGGALALYWLLKIPPLRKLAFEIL